MNTSTAAPARAPEALPEGLPTQTQMKKAPPPASTEILNGLRDGEHLQARAILQDNQSPRFQFSLFEIIRGRSHPPGAMLELQFGSSAQATATPKLETELLGSDQRHILTALKRKIRNSVRYSPALEDEQHRLAEEYETQRIKGKDRLESAYIQVPELLSAIWIEPKDNLLRRILSPRKNPVFRISWLEDESLRGTIYIPGHPKGTVLDISAARLEAQAVQARVMRR